MDYTPEQRKSISDQCSGKTVLTLEWSAEPNGADGYWVMTFTDSTEITFRFMAELQR